MLRIGLLLVGVCALAVIAALKPDVLPGNLRSIVQRAPAKQTAASSPNAAAPVRVAVAQVRAEDVPIYLSGIGTVQAYNTINVTTRVDGAITQILFQEGQDVKAGDPLPAARRHIEIADGFADVGRDFIPVELRVFVDQVRRRCVAKLPVQADFLEFVVERIGFP